MRFLIHESESGEVWFTLVAANGQIVAVSEMYTRKQSALDTIASIKTGVGPDTPIEDAP